MFKAIRNLLSGNKSVTQDKHQRPLFHGGCHGCQESLATCPGCQYFEADWSLPDLNDAHRKEEQAVNVWREMARQDRADQKGA